MENIEYRIENIEKNIDTLYKEVEKLKENKEDVKVGFALLNKEVQSLGQKMDSLTETVLKLTSKDAESWDKSKWIIITSIISAILGYIISSVGLK